MLALLLGTHLWYPATAPIARYDLLTVAAVLIQAAMLIIVSFVLVSLVHRVAPPDTASPR